MELITKTNAWYSIVCVEESACALFLEAGGNDGIFFRSASSEFRRKDCLGGNISESHRACLLVRDVGASLDHSELARRSVDFAGQVESFSDFTNA